MTDAYRILLVTTDDRLAGQVRDRLRTRFDIKVISPADMAAGATAPDAYLLDENLGSSRLRAVIFDVLQGSSGAAILVLKRPESIEGGTPYIRMGVQDVVSVSDDRGSALLDRVQMSIERARILGVMQEAAFHIRSVVEHVSDAILIIDRDHQIVFANPACQDLLGLSFEELYGAECPFGLPDSSISPKVMHILDWTRPDGTATHAGVFVSTLRWDGREALMLTMRDLSAEYETREELIRAKSTAEKTEELKASFLANMSHELRVPLASIIGFAEILAENAQDDETREFATLIQESGGRLLRSINAVLDMTRLEAGKYEPVFEHVDIGEVIDSAVRLMKPLADEKNIELVRLGPSTLMFNTDPLFVERIVNNLVGNAIKFTTEGSVSVDWTGNTDGLAMTVKDTGIGISDEFLPALFDEFTQESTGRGRTHDGTGLGLSITYKLVERLGGHIEVASTKHVGTVFNVTLPHLDH